jgi:hypothetical protein
LITRSASPGLTFIPAKARHSHANRSHLFVILTAVSGASVARITLQDANAASNYDNSSCNHYDTSDNSKNALEIIHL